MPNKLRAREAGDSTSGISFFERAFARFAGSNFLLHDPWGLCPRLYASVRFADSKQISDSSSMLLPSIAYRTLVPSDLNSNPATNQDRRPKRSNGSFTNFVTLIKNIFNRSEDFQSMRQTF